jgi:hypothetical protein
VCISITSAKLFIAHPNPGAWNAREEGVLELARHSKTTFPYINLYDFGNVRLVFQHELYQDFTKSFQIIEGSSFATIQSDSCVIGLSFTDPAAAIKFRMEVKTFFTSQKTGWFSRHFTAQPSGPEPPRSGFKLRQRSASSRTLPGLESALTGVQVSCPVVQKQDPARFISDDLKKSEDFQKFVVEKTIPLEDLDNAALTTTIVQSYLCWLTDPKRNEPPVSVPAPAPAPSVSASARLKRSVSSKSLPVPILEGVPGVSRSESAAEGESLHSTNQNYVEPRVEFPPGCNPMAVIAERLALRRQFFATEAQIPAI